MRKAPVVMTAALLALGIAAEAHAQQQGSQHGGIRQ